MYVKIAQVRLACHALRVIRTSSNPVFRERETPPSIIYNGPRGVLSTVGFTSSIFTWCMQYGGHLGAGELGGDL